MDVPLPPEAGGYTPVEEEGALWSIVVMCQETISARFKKPSCVWETMSRAGGMSTLIIWAWSVGIYGLESLCLAWGRCWGIPLPTPWKPNISK